MKQIIVNISLLLITLILFLSALEIFLANFYPQPTEFFKIDDITGSRIHIPNKEGWFRDAEFKNYHRINSQGWHDVKRNYSKLENTFRILILGDSFTDGFEVDFEDSFAKILEKNLNQRNLSKKFEVLNFGVRGTGTAEQFLLFKEYGKRYNPDLVLLAFLTSNDFFDNSNKTNLFKTERPYFEITENNTLKLYKPKISNEEITEENFFIKTEIYNFFKRRLTALKDNSERKVNNTEWTNYLNEIYFKEKSIYFYNYSGTVSEAVNLTKKIILMLKEEAEKSDAEFVLVTLANIEQVEQNLMKKELLKGNKIDLEKPDEIMREFCSAKNLSCLQLLPAFKNASKETNLKFFFQIDTHWNEEGHKLVAKTIEEFLLKNHLLKNDLIPVEANNSIKKEN